MRRRAFLAGAGGFAAVAGCLSDSDDDRHPFAGQTVTVQVDANSATAYDLRANAADALSFWERNGPRYAGFDIGFDVVETADPDVVLAYDDDASGCEDASGFSEGVLGCAPVLGPETSVPDPVVAHVVAGRRPSGQVLVTAQHEIGHVLGLGHDDDPPEVMSNRPADRIPLYDTRLDVWDELLDARSQLSEGNDRYASGIALWNDGDFAAAEPVFEDAATAFDAAVDGFDTASRTADPLGGLEQPGTVQLDELRQLLDRLATQSTLGAAAATAMVDASEAAESMDAATANARRDDANQQITDAGTLDAVELGNVAAALGLVRGVGRDDAVTVDGNSD